MVYIRARMKIKGRGLKSMGGQGARGHIFLASPHMSQEGYEKKYIQEAFESNWIAPLGKNVTEFEREMEERTGAGRAVALSSGTAAVHMALKAAGVSRGDIVLCQSLTFAATANPIMYEGAVPVFIDSEEGTWNMSPSALEGAFRRYGGMGRRPKAAIVVHLYGICARIEEIAAICRRHGAVLIEDAAESLGTVHGGRHTGTFGDYGVLSFNGNKIITTSGGGMLLVNTTDADRDAGKVLFWATQARERAAWYQHEEVGYNYRMSNVAAGIGRGQLRVLEERVRRKREIYQFYKERIGDLEGLSLMPLEMAGSGNRNNCWLTAAQLGDGSPVSVSQAMDALQGNDIESRPVWKPMHLQPVFRGCGFVSDSQDTGRIDGAMGVDNSVAGRLFGHGLCLPSDTKMTEGDLDRVCGVLSALWEGKG